MHFWIDKRSQACGFNGRHFVSPSISGYGRNQRFLCGGYRAKPMVTPVHRFQSIESVATNGIRHARSPGYHTRFPVIIQTNVNHNGGANRNHQIARSVEILPNTASHTPTPRRLNTPTTRLKCGVWVFFAVITLFLTGAKYYFHGVSVHIGVEALALCSLLLVILVIAGLISLYEAISGPSNELQREIINLGAQHGTNELPINPGGGHHHHNHSDHNVNNESEDNTSTSVVITNVQAEMPPPPYHIAIMLPPHQHHQDPDSIQVIRDSPPPSYEKAVT